MRKKCVLFSLFCLLGAAVFSADGYALDYVCSGLRMHKPVRSMKEIKNENVVKQSLDYSCGPAGLATLLHFCLDDQIGEKEIINELLKTTSLQKVLKRKGFSLLDLKKFLEARGYSADGYQMDIEYLKESGLPVLVPIKFKNYRHFVVVKRVIGDRVFIADPAVGNVILKINYFNSIWQDGIALVVEKKDGTSVAHSYDVKEKDGVFVDYSSIERMIQRGALRTTVFSTEF